MNNAGIDTVLENHSLVDRTKMYLMLFSMTKGLTKESEKKLKVKYTELMKKVRSQIELFLDNPFEEGEEIMALEMEIRKDFGELFSVKAKKSNIILPNGRRA